MPGGGFQKPRWEVPRQNSSLTGKEGGPGQQESTPVPLLFLQTCGNLCLSLYGHPLITPNRSVSPTSSPYAIWTDTGTVMSPPMASTERHSTFIWGELVQLESHTSGAAIGSQLRQSLAGPSQETQGLVVKVLRLYVNKSS